MAEAMGNYSIIRQDAKENSHVILIVDNDDSFLDATSQHLRSEGYIVITTGTPVSGLDILDKRKVDLVLSGTRTPEMDGFGFVEAVRSNPKWNKIPFFLLSDKDVPEEKVRGLESGADDYLIKPVNQQELAIRIRRCIKMEEDSQPDMKGKIKENTVCEIMQYISNANLTGLLILDSGGIKAKIWFMKGELAKAVCGKKKNEDAIYRAIGFDSGTFVFREEEVSSEKEINVSVLAVILEGARIQDERKNNVIPLNENYISNEYIIELDPEDALPEEDVQAEHQDGEEVMSKADRLLSELYDMDEVKDGLVISQQGDIISGQVSEQMAKLADTAKYFAMASLQLKGIIGFQQPWYLQADEKGGDKLLIIIAEGVFVILLLNTMAVPACMYPELYNKISGYSLMEG